MKLKISWPIGRLFSNLLPTITKRFDDECPIRSFDNLFPLPELRGFPRNRSSTIYNRVFSNICDDCPQRISIDNLKSLATIWGKGVKFVLKIVKDALGGRDRNELSISDE